MKIKTILIGLILFLSTGGIAFASDISDAQYIATVRITNNSTATTYVAVPITGANTTNLINQGFLNATANNSVMRSSAGADVPFMPGYNAAWFTYVDSIGENTMIDYTWYNNSTGGMHVYFPGAAGMTTSDNATLELGDNFTITLSDVWINTTAGASKYILYKTSALELYVDASTSGKITAKVPAHSASSVNIRPDAAGDYCNINDGTSTCPNDYQAVDDPGAHDSDTTYLRRSGAWVWDAYNLATPSLPAGVEITSLQVYMVVRAEVANTANYRSGLRLSGVESLGESHTDSTITYHTFTDTISRPGGGDWSEGDLTDLQVLLGLSSTGQVPRCTQIYVIVNYQYPEVSVDVSGISSGEYDIVLSGNETDISLDVGGTSNSTSFSGIGDSANDYISFENDTVLYAGSQNITVDGSLKQFVEWEYGTTFSDSSGNSNDATPTFRTTGSDADVSAEFISFRPASPATAPAYSVSVAPDFITGNITANSTFTSGNATPGTRPGDAVVDAAAEAAGVPNVWLWGILGIVTIALSGLLISYMEKKYGSGNGTMFLRFGITLGILGILVTFGIFDFWMIILYSIPAIALLMASRHYDFNMSISQLNLIGFLAMTWIGLTMINQIQEGQLITAAETAHLNNLMFTQEFTLLDTFHLPILNFEFFSVGIPSLLQWDYSFFGGNAQIIQYFLYSLTAVVSLIVLLIIIGTVSSYFVRST